MGVLSWGIRFGMLSEALGGFLRVFGVGVEGGLSGVGCLLCCGFLFLFARVLVGWAWLVRL